MNTPSPEQIEQARKWYEGTERERLASFKDLDGSRTFDEETIRVASGANAKSLAPRLAAYAAHVQAQAASVQPDDQSWESVGRVAKEMYEAGRGCDISIDGHAGFHAVIHPTKGLYHGYGDSINEALKEADAKYKRGDPPDAEYGHGQHEQLWEVIRQRLSSAANGEKERSGPSMEEIMEAWGATLDKWKHELKGDGFDTSAGHEAAYAEWVAAKARSAEGSVTA